CKICIFLFFFSSRRRHTRSKRDWSSDVCSSDLQKLHGGEVDSFRDHRIAMAFAVAALRAEGETKISRADVAVISYPGFFDTLERSEERRVGKECRCRWST